MQNTNLDLKDGLQPTEMNDLNKLRNIDFKNLSSDSLKIIEWQVKKVIEYTKQINVDIKTYLKFINKFKPKEWRYDIALVQLWGKINWIYEGDIDWYYGPKTEKMINNPTFVSFVESWNITIVNEKFDKSLEKGIEISRSIQVIIANLNDLKQQKTEIEEKLNYWPNIDLQNQLNDINKKIDDILEQIKQKTRELEKITSWTQPIPEKEKSTKTPKYSPTYPSRSRPKQILPKTITPKWIEHKQPEEPTSDTTKLPQPSGPVDRVEPQVSVPTPSQEPDTHPIPVPQPSPSSEVLDTKWDEQRWSLPNPQSNITPNPEVWWREKERQKWVTPTLQQPTEIGPENKSLWRGPDISTWSKDALPSSQSSQINPEVWWKDTERHQEVINPSTSDNQKPTVWEIELPIIPESPVLPKAPVVNELPKVPESKESKNITASIYNPEIVKKDWKTYIIWKDEHWNVISIPWNVLEWKEMFLTDQNILDRIWNLYILIDGLYLSWDTNIVQKKKEIMDKLISLNSKEELLLYIKTIYDDIANSPKAEWLTIIISKLKNSDDLSQSKIEILNYLKNNLKQHEYVRDYITNLSIRNFYNDSQLQAIFSDLESWKWSDQLREQDLDEYQRFSRRDTEVLWDKYELQIIDSLRKEVNKKHPDKSPSEIDSIMEPLITWVEKSFKNNLKYNYLKRLLLTKKIEEDSSYSKLDWYLGNDKYLDIFAEEEWLWLRVFSPKSIDAMNNFAEIVAMESIVVLVWLIISYPFSKVIETLAYMNRGYRTIKWAETIYEIGTTISTSSKIAGRTIFWWVTAFELWVETISINEIWNIVHNLYWWNEWHEWYFDTDSLSKTWTILAIVKSFNWLRSIWKLSVLQEKSWEWILKTPIKFATNTVIDWTVMWLADTGWEIYIEWWAWEMTVEEFFQLIWIAIALRWAWWWIRNAKERQRMRVIKSEKWRQFIQEVVPESEQIKSGNDFENVVVPEKDIVIKPASVRPPSVPDTSAVQKPIEVKPPTQITQTSSDLWVPKAPARPVESDKIESDINKQTLKSKNQGLYDYTASLLQRHANWESESSILKDANSMSNNPIFGGWVKIESINQIKEYNTLARNNLRMLWVELPDLTSSSNQSSKVEITPKQVASTPEVTYNIRRTPSWTPVFEIKWQKETKYERSIKEGNFIIEPVEINWEYKVELTNSRTKDKYWPFDNITDAQKKIDELKSNQ